jgi:hypothetical protein
MNEEPRRQSEYSLRQIEAAKRVLIDLWQVLAAFQDCLVVIGGWVPDLLLENADDPHIGSIDVDLALDAEKLGDGRYAELIKLLLDTRRYHQADEAFRLYTLVDLDDGESPVRVDVDFLKPKETKTKKNQPKLLPRFRPLDADGCAAAFLHPELVVLSGQMMSGAKNTVRFRVASLPNFLVMKAYALAGRDKPKDAYDLCYCLDHFPGGMEKLAAAWRGRRRKKDVSRAIEILREKFVSVEDYGPRQVVEFLDLPDLDAQAMQARRAFELVHKFLSLL